MPWNSNQEVTTPIEKEPRFTLNHDTPGRSLTSNNEPRGPLPVVPPWEAWPVAGNDPRPIALLVVGSEDVDGRWCGCQAIEADLPRCDTSSLFQRIAMSQDRGTRK